MDAGSWEEIYRLQSHHRDAMRWICHAIHLLQEATRKSKAKCHFVNKFPKNKKCMKPVSSLYEIHAEAPFTSSGHWCSLYSLKTACSWCQANVFLYPGKILGIKKKKTRYFHSHFPPLFFIIITKKKNCSYWIFNLDSLKKPPKRNDCVCFQSIYFDIKWLLELIFQSILLYIESLHTKTQLAVILIFFIDLLNEHMFLLII